MKFSKLKMLGGGLALLAMCCAPAAAQSKKMTPQEQKNLKMVLDWWREGFVAGHAEAADKYLAENMIQHNPNFPQGRAPVKAILSRRCGSPICALPPKAPNAGSGQAM